MNKRLIALSLVVTLFAAQTANANTDKKYTGKKPWYNKTTKYGLANLQNYFANQYLNDENSAAEKTLKKAEDDIIKTIKTGVSNLNKERESQVNMMVDSFITNASNAIGKEKQEISRRFSKNTLTRGKLLALVYDISGIKTPSPVYTEIALTNDGYFKEYFLEANKPFVGGSFFYSEPTKAPWGSWLGLGYVNKQSRGRYWRNKAIGAAVATGAAIGGYYGIKHAGGYENKEQVYEGAKKFASDFYEKGKGWVAGLFTKREEQNIHNIEQKIEKEENKINSNNAKIHNMEQQKDDVMQDPNLSDTTKNKKVKFFDQKIDNLVKENDYANKEIQEAQKTLNKIETRASERNEKKNNPKIATKEEVLKRIAYQNKQNTKQVKRLRKNTEKMEDISNNTEKMEDISNIEPGTQSYRERFSNWLNQRNQEKREQEAAAQSRYDSRKKVYANLDEYQEAIRQKEVDQRMTPWYKRWF